MALKDLLELLDRWDEWRRIRQAPTRIDALEARIQALEQKLGEDWPADVCKHCGKRAARFSHSVVADSKKGIVLQEWACSECGHYETRPDRPR
jgi:hypothetical protein